MFQRKFGTFGTGDEDFQYPSGVTLDPSGNIYVVDTYNNRVQKFDSSFVYHSRIGTYGEEIDCGVNTTNDCAEEYDWGTTVSLTRTAEMSGYFMEWSGVKCASNVNPCEFEIREDTTIKAVFRPQPTVTSVTGNNPQVAG